MANQSWTWFFRRGLHQSRHRDGSVPIDLQQFLIPQVDNHALVYRSRSRHGTIMMAYNAHGYTSIPLTGNYKSNVLIRQFSIRDMASLALWAVYLTMKRLSLLVAKSVVDLRVAREIFKYFGRLRHHETEIAHNIDKYRPHNLSCKDGVYAEDAA